jgi:hypothetical protein
MVLTLRCNIYKLYSQNSRTCQRDNDKQVRGPSSGRGFNHDRGVKVSIGGRGCKWCWYTILTLYPNISDVGISF